jgi:hypothetical protein
VGRRFGVNRRVGYLLFWLLVPTVFITLFHTFSIFVVPITLLLDFLEVPPLAQGALGFLLTIPVAIAAALLIWRAWQGLRANTSVGPRLEFAVRPSDASWFALDRSNFSEVFRPSTQESQEISGWGDHRIRVAGVEIAFSVEDSGIEISFEGDISDSDASHLSEEIRANIERATGQGATLIPL